MNARIRRRLVFWTIVVLVIAFFLGWAGHLLVVDVPLHSDVILVLAGETDRRPARGVELLNQGYARRLILDVPSESEIFGSSELELARKYVESLPQATAISLCPIQASSTRDEALDAEKCFKPEDSSVLIVTSDFHTRRAVSIFRHEIRGKNFSIAATRDQTQFGTRWWQHRQWAKTFFDEGLRWLWWKSVDQWRR